MIQRVAAAVLLPLLASTACRTAPSPESDVLRVLDLQRDAWNRGDVEDFVELGYWRSPDLTFFSGGTVTKGYEPLVARYRERYAESSAGMGQLEFSELEPFALGEDAVLVRGRWKLEREGSAPLGGLFTLLLRRIDGSWRIVHDHTSTDEPAE